MNGKKILPLFVIASMLLSLLPSVMFAHADPLTIVPAPNNGVKGAEIHVTGNAGGAPAGSTLQIYWDDATIAWNGVKGLLNSTTVGADGLYEVWFDVPEAVGGTHYLWIKTTTGSDKAVFTVNSVIDVSPSRGLELDTITATMSGYAKSAVLQLTFNGNNLVKVTANSIGSATTTFKVPDLAPGAYTIATNATAATAPFTIGPVITVSPTSGPVGTVVTINGRGFSEWDVIDQGDLDLSGLACYITSTTPINVDGTGRVRLNAVIAGKTTKDDYVLTLNTNSTNLATADFEVTAVAKVSVTPEWGPQASTITVSGVNYPKIKDVVITVDLGGVNIGTVKTLADGTFSKAFKVPAIADGKESVDAYNTAYLIADDAGFKVGTMNIILGDDSGATGTTLGLTANGFTPNEGWNATIGNDEIGSGTVNGVGLISTTWMVPQLAVGTYTITVWDIDAEIKLTTTFRVTKTTSVELSVASAPIGFKVDMYGYGFADTDGPVNFVIYNKTSTGALDFWWGDGFPAASTNSTGEFETTWTVQEELSKGNYFINATDPVDYAVTIPFTVGDVHIVATPRKPSFKVGETISFNLEHSFGNIAPVLNSVLKIYNPSGALVYSGDELATWTKTGLWYTAPYSSQTAGKNPMVLTEDAPLGTWSWKWIDANGDTIKNGTLTLVASDAAATDAKITALATQITALQTAVTGLTTAATAAGTKADAATAAATASGAKADAATAAATAAGTKADAAATAAGSAAASAKSAADGVSGLTTLVYAAIGASLIAALAAIVALMQISRKIA
jgi:hypothetical protein